MSAPAVDTHARPAAAPGRTLCRRVAKFASGLRDEDIPAEMHERAKCLMLDEMTCAAYPETIFPKYFPGGLVIRAGDAVAAERLSG